MKVVLDTNVLVSALIKAGRPRELLFKIVEEEVLILSRSILEEFLKVADDPRIRRYVSVDDIIAFLKVVGSVAEIVRVRSRFKVVKEDPADDIILRTAYDGKADYVVSGDNHLLSMREFRGIKIVTVDEMLMLL
jgi:hypothetical protein